MAKLCGPSPRNRPDTIANWEAGAVQVVQSAALFVLDTVGCEPRLTLIGEEIISVGDA